MQTPKPSQTHNLELAVKSLILSSEKEQPPFYNSCISPSPSLMGDYIGMESCVDLRNNEERDILKDDGMEAYSQRRGKQRDHQWWEMKKMKKKKEFPPPIPSLARTGNLQSHMPWVLKRYYTSDGRLIIREEKVRHHEYFRAHRANGRLTLQLVPLDDDVFSPPEAEEDGYIDAAAETEEDAETYDDDECLCNDDHSKAGNIDKDDVGKEMIHKDQTVMEKSTMKLAPDQSSSMENGSAGIGGKGVGKCFEYNSLRSRSSSSCILGMPLPPIRPVHS